MELIFNKLKGEINHQKKFQVLIFTVIKNKFQIPFICR
jgi:hypothetical protein